MRRKFVLQMLLATLSFAVIGILIALSVGAPDCSSYCLAKETNPATTLQTGSTRQSSTVATPAQVPPDAEKLRAETRTVEELLSRTVERGAAVCFLARRYARLGDPQKALALLKECVAAGVGYDPSAVPAFQPMQTNAAFRELVEQARRQCPPVHLARVAFTMPDKDLFPEGLAVDAEKRVFYMGSMHRKKIVKITEAGKVSDFVPEGRYDLMPVGGVHVDPADHSVWAATDPGEKNRSEIVHFDAEGKLLERYTAPGVGVHDLNDLVLRGATEIFVTDTDANLVFRFDRKSHNFTAMKFPRAIFYPNGITLSGDQNLLYVGDILSVLVMDLRNNTVKEVKPGPKNTLAGIDGLYWYKGDLVGVQYGTGSFRVMRWRLSKDGYNVTSSEVLERDTELLSFPTTGAILNGEFYFMANTGIGNLKDDKVVDDSKLEPVKIAVVALK